MIFASSGQILADDKPVFKIGVVYALTGDLAFLGEGMRDALLMAKEELGDTKFDYEFIFEDDQLNPKLTVGAAKKLVSIDKVDAIFSLGSDTGTVVSGLARKADIVHIGVAIKPDVTKGEHNYSHWIPPEVEVGALVDELQRRGIKKLGIIRSMYEGFVVHMDVMHKLIKNTDIEIVTDQAFQVGEKDFRSLIAKAKQSDPEIYLLLAMSPGLEIVTKQMREAGINTPLTAIESFEASKEVDLFEGYWYVSAAEPKARFGNAFTKKYGKAPSVGAPNAYDSFNLLVSAVEKAGSTKVPSADSISRELKKIKNYDGALGSLTVREDGRVLSEAAVKLVKNGKFVPAE